MKCPTNCTYQKRDQGPRDAEKADEVESMTSSKIEREWGANDQWLPAGQESVCRWIGAESSTRVRSVTRSDPGCVAWPWHRIISRVGEDVHQSRARDLPRRFSSSRRATSAVSPTVSLPVGDFYWPLRDWCTAVTPFFDRFVPPRPPCLSLL